MGRQHLAAMQGRGCHTPAAAAHSQCRLLRAAVVVEALSGLHCLAEGAASITLAADSLQLSISTSELVVQATATCHVNILSAGVASITLAALHGQLSLLLFGLDSVVEVASVMLVLWSLQGRHIGKARERTATGGIGLLLVLLAAAAVAASVVHLVRHETPDAATAGLVIGCISTFDMLCFAAIKRYLARRLGSKCLVADATCSLACASLGVVLVIGSAVYMTHPRVWWVDAAAALLLSALICREGLGMVQNARSPDFEIGGCC